MAVLVRDRDHLFTIFEQDGTVYLSAVTGGIHQYEATIRLKPDEVDGILHDRERQLRLAHLLSTNPDAFAERRVTIAVP